MMKYGLITLLLLSACQNPPVEPVVFQPGAGSETHWLEPCVSDAACDVGQCICRICTVVCDPSTVCNGEAQPARCTAIDSDAAQLQCGAEIPQAICLPECGPDVECSRGGHCVQGSCVGRSTEQAITLPGQPKVDYLFVIDDSGSMCEEQDNLARNFARISAQIAQTDYRIAVVSADLYADDAGQFLVRPAAPVPSLNCTDENGNPQAPNTADCSELVQSGLKPILKPDDIAQDDLATAFRCLATLGTSGDGFEKGLEAMRTALWCGGPNADKFGACCADGKYDPQCNGSAGLPEFLRPDASLVVAFISDENDCSAPMDNPTLATRAICKHGLLDSDQDGIPDAFQDPILCPDGEEECARRECPDQDFATCMMRCEISRSENSNCEWFSDNLTSIADYRDFLLQFKGADRIAIWAIAGEEKYTASGDPLRYTPGLPSNPECDPDSDQFNPNISLDICCPDGQCQGRIQPSCESSNGTGFAGYRYAELADAFLLSCGPEDGCSICVDDFGAVLPQTYEQTVGALYTTMCLERAPICAVAVGDELRTCRTAEERADRRNYSIEVTVSCLSTPAEGGECAELVSSHALPPDAWQLEATPNCPGRAAVRLNEAAPAGGTVQVVYISN